MVQSFHHETPSDQKPHPERDQLGFPDAACIVDRELPETRSDFARGREVVGLEVEVEKQIAGDLFERAASSRKVPPPGFEPGA